MKCYSHLCILLFLGWTLSLYAKANDSVRTGHETNIFDFGTSDKAVALSINGEPTFNRNGSSSGSFGFGIPIDTSSYDLERKSETIFFGPMPMCLPGTLTTSSFAYGHYQGVNSTDASILTVDYSAIGSNPAKVTEAQISDFGSIYGMAINQDNSTAFFGAYMKRHAGFGPNGPGAIYYIDPGTDGVRGTADDVKGLFTNLSAGTDPHPQITEANGGDWFHDTDSWEPVGKIGLGDIDMSDDGTQLYTINLFDRKLYSMAISSYSPPTIGSVVTIDLPEPSGCPIDPATQPGEMNRNIRPFGLKVASNGNIYVGMVCTAESTGLDTDLRAFVYEYSGGSWSQVLNFPLDNANYPRGTDIGADIRWRPWINNFNQTQFLAVDNSFRYATQPWLTDIEFDGEDMILGFRDRTGDQLGRLAGSPDVNDSGQYNGLAYGDILRACGSFSTGWTLESNGSCGGTTTMGANNGRGPNGGEYYHGEGVAHINSSIGSLAVNPEEDEVVTGLVDPEPGVTAGLQWLNNTTGDAEKAAVLSNAGITAQGFGKANGLGDLEILCGAIEICSLNDAGKTNETCNDNGTEDAADDFITFELNPTGSNLGSNGYLVTVDNNGVLNQTTGDYGGSTAFQLQAGSADGTVYTITITDADDPNCSITTTVQQSPCSTTCPPNEFVICDDNSNVATLTADPGYTNYVWYEYDEATMTKGIQVGLGQVLSVTGSDIGPAGSRKCYVYEANDSQGCLGELCCPVCVTTENCCPNPNCYTVQVLTRTE